LIWILLRRVGKTAEPDGMMFPVIVCVKVKY
jgi:hypothetical protein